jgi:cytochrome c5
MYILENTMLKKIVIGLSISASMLIFAGCVADKENTTKRAVDGGMKYEVKDGKYTAYHVNTQETKEFKYGRIPTPREIKAWDIDVRPDGTGAPMYDTNDGKILLDENGKKKTAEGSVEWGNELYDAQCAMCHGDFGSGGKGYPTLSGGELSSLTNQLQNPSDEVPMEEPPRKAIGSYWPYASTLFWYIQDAMPFPHPKSLSNSETYAITAYLLMENSITIDGEELDEEFVMNREQFLKVKMPNENGFYPKVDTPENPQQGAENIRKFLGNPENYGTGTRCMTDCIKGETPILRIKNEMNNFHPAASTVRDLPQVEVKSGTVHPGLAGYEASCSACHGNSAIGAPVVGDKEAWAEVISKGLDKVYHNGINGINAMPPKGGNMDLSDSEMKVIIDYMITSSK